jgi:hypothetical protein
MYLCAFQQRARRGQVLTACPGIVQRTCRGPGSWVPIRGARAAKPLRSHHCCSLSVTQARARSMAGRFKPLTQHDSSSWCSPCLSICATPGISLCPTEAPAEVDMHAAMSVALDNHCLLEPMLRLATCERIDQGPGCQPLALRT